MKISLLQSPIASPDFQDSTLQLEKELHLIKFLMEHFPDAVFWITSDARVIYVNYAACNLVGYSSDKLLSMTVHDIVSDFSLEVWPRYWQTIKQQGCLYLKSVYQTSENQSIPVEINATYMEYERKEYGCILIRDISQRQQASFDLHKTNQILQVPTPSLSETVKSVNPESIFPRNFHLNQVFDYIEANYHQPISLHDVATAVGYCPAYLTDLVRRHTGQTVNHWIIERRMAAARSLLLEGKLCVNQIAEVVGYQHEGHFFRQFRQHHGTTPQAWRKTQLTNATTINNNIETKELLYKH